MDSHFNQTRINQIDSVECDWNEFLQKLFNQSPQDPFTFTLQFIDQLDPQKLPQFLGHMLITGAQILYDKEIAQLDPHEIDHLQKYYRSIGYEVEYQIKTDTQYLPQLNQKLPVNFFQIDFKPCSQKYNYYNKPTQFI